MSGASRSILVVDDSSDLQLLVTTLLHVGYYRILSAGDSIQATGLAVREKPDIIALDIGLPAGDGFLLLDRPRANTHTRHIPIVVTTGQATPGLDAKAKTKGAMAYMQKPIDKQILLDTVEQVLRESECTQVKPI
jgi:CheY-like chemotaxis protein